MANPYNSADPIVLEAYQAKLGRALENPLLAASEAGSPANLACIQRIEDVRAAIQQLTTPAAIYDERLKQEEARRTAQRHLDAMKEEPSG